MADLEKLIDEMGKRYKSESKSRKTIESLRPFLDGVGRYSAVIDTMVSSNPMVSALIWGGFKFILITATEYGQYLQELAELLEKLGPTLVYWISGRVAENIYNRDRKCLRTKFTKGWKGVGPKQLSRRKINYSVNFQRRYHYSAGLDIKSVAL
ncbi:hypothetical protein FPQ18DRAFT_310746 [Pyronema domesticum]|nr:hypothetical protein FPQ18DRAFT_310746 [Pyronema domesticum]